MIAYLRVSTARQGASGLGLDAQRSAIAAYAARTGQEVTLELVEVETGTNKRDRPVLVQAIREAQRTGEPIVTAKLDRLARSVSAICAIRESGVRFIALDLPETENPLFLHIIAALAEYEAKLISERTKAALAAKRAKGWKQKSLGFANPADAKKGPLVSWSRAVAREQQMAAHAETLLQMGMGAPQIAEKLNQEGYRNVNGNLIDRWMVRKMLIRRAEALTGEKPGAFGKRRRREKLDEKLWRANLRAQSKRRAEERERRKASSKHQA